MNFPAKILSSKLYGQHYQMYTPCFVQVRPWKRELEGCLDSPVHKSIDELRRNDVACLPVSQQTYLEKKKRHSHITLSVKSEFLRGVISLWCDGQQSLLVVVVLFCVRHFVFDGKCLQRSRKHKWRKQEAGAGSSAGGEGGSLDASFEDCFTIWKDCRFTLGMETPCQSLGTNSASCLWIVMFAKILQTASE